jgi:hypothetical protein
MILYLDPSALVKLYVIEIYSDKVRTACAAARSLPARLAGYLLPPSGRLPHTSLLASGDHGPAALRVSRMLCLSRLCKVLLSLIERDEL